MGKDITTEKFREGDYRIIEQVTFGREQIGSGIRYHCGFKGGVFLMPDEI